MKKLSDSMKNMRLPFCSAVIVAGGSSQRFGADKLFAEIGGDCVLGLSIRAFARSECIQEIILVVREEILAKAAETAKNYGENKVSLIVPGGKTRALSSYAGVMSVSSKARLIAIHDGARPLVSDRVIRDAIWAAYRSGAAAPAVAVKDTIKIAAEGLVSQTPERENLFAVQTPQVFRPEIIRAALTNAAQKQIRTTDDCSAAEAIGAPVVLTVGDEENIKITTPLDLELAKLILQRNVP